MGGGAGGVADGQTFAVDVDGAGPNLPASFEFDKDGVFTDANADGLADNRLINIADNLTLNVRATADWGSTIAISSRLSNGTTTYTFEFDRTTPCRSPNNQRINVANNLLLRCRGRAVALVACGTAIRSVSMRTEPGFAAGGV